MGFWSATINLMVVGFALFFTVIGLVFVAYSLTGSTPLGSPGRLEDGPLWEKGVMGVIFLVAAAPMFYYVVGHGAKGLPPPEKRRARRDAEDSGPKSP